MHGRFAWSSSVGKETGKPRPDNQNTPANDIDRGNEIPFLFAPDYVIVFPVYAISLLVLYFDNPLLKRTHYIRLS